MNIISLVIIGICVAVGYLSQPFLFGPKGAMAGLLYKQPVKSPATPDDDIAVVVDSSLDSPAVVSGVEKTVSFSMDKVIKADFPESCKMTRSGFASITGGNAALDVGAKLKPISIKDEKLTVIIESLGVEGTVPVGVTDFLKLTIPITMARLNGGPGMVPDPIVSNDPAPKVSEDNKPSFGDPFAGIDTSEQIDPFAVGLTEPRVAEPDTGELSKPAENLISDAELKSLIEKEYSLVEALKNVEVNSISIGELEENGESSFQTGTVSFKKKTLLGVRELSAKALISDGKIVKWVWSKSGQEVE